MVLHPVIIIPKLIMILIFAIVLIVLHAVLPPGAFLIAVLISVVVFAVLMIVFWAIVVRLLKNPNTKISRMVVLSGEQRADEGYRASSGEFEVLVGRRGKTMSALRPSGIVQVDNKRVPVLTEGGFISADTEVEIVSVKGSRVFVRPVED